MREKEKVREIKNGQWIMSKGKKVEGRRKGVSRES
jgi:hypothetical protein